LESKLREFLSQDRSKFYLRDFVEHAKVSLLEAEDFFIPLLKENEIEGSLEVRCPSCGAELGIYKKYLDVPEEITCELCGEEFPRSSDFLEIVLEVKGRFFRTREESPESDWEKAHERRTEEVVEGCRWGEERLKERKEV
jgi:ribosomal protein S27E